MSIADLFVVRRKVWLEFQKYQSDGVLKGDGNRGFKESRFGMKLGDFIGSEKEIGKIKENPEGQFEYAADLTFAFVNKRREIIVDKAATLGKKFSISHESQRRKLESDLDCKTDIQDDLKWQHNSMNSSRNGGEYPTQGENRRKLFGSRTTSDRMEMIRSLRQSIVFPFTSDTFESSRDDERVIKVHELSFLDMINGVATTQHIVQVEVDKVKIKVRASIWRYFMC